MPVPESFQAFRFALEREISASGIKDAIEEAIGEVPSWPGDKAASWLRELGPWLDAMDLHHLVESRAQDLDITGDQPTVWEIRDLAADLFGVLAGRVVDSGATCPFREVEGFIRSEACVPRAFRLPRRILLDAYERWIEDDSVPCVATYARQVARCAAPSERVHLARLATRAGTEIEDYTTGWLAVAIPDLMILDPESVVPWVERLREAWSYELDAPREVQLEHFDRWIERARRAFGAGDHARTTKGDDSEEPPPTTPESAPAMPAHVTDNACDESLSWLLPYLLLVENPDVSVTVCCTHLAIAVESQLRHVLSLHLPGRVARRVREQGLGSLARFLCGERSILDDFARLATEVEDDLKMSLTRAGNIRNRLHHPKVRQPLEKEDLEFLQEMILGYTSFGRLLERMKTIEAVPK